ncbi:BolA family protein [Frateuria hangzhouensis]|uniref:BolA family protein n=1 Tax=Frateuria hangzhouensis TaxID=2995589 RepID=UPI0022608429|nr:BolA/IbaG family iron-sulfur metabolism protein [Frateuria sp. STR12]MCX7514036.1 BolA/IbaG family iron-sulfur metabolism protein [Frateuria sp. STR12]
MDPSRIQSLIETGLPGANAQVSGDDGVHFEATVVASQFAGKLPLARHRMVYATLGELMGGAIHALALKTLTPEEAGIRESGFGNR